MSCFDRIPNTYKIYWYTKIFIWSIFSLIQCFVKFLDHGVLDDELNYFDVSWKTIYEDAINTIPADAANPSRHRTVAWKYNAPSISSTIHIAAYFLDRDNGTQSPMTPANSNIPLQSLHRGSCQSLVNRATDSGIPRNLNGNVCRSIIEMMSIAICGKVRKLRIFVIIKDGKK